MKEISQIVITVLIFVASIIVFVVLLHTISYADCEITNRKENKIYNTSGHILCPRKKYKKRGKKNERIF